MQRIGVTLVVMLFAVSAWGRGGGEQAVPFEERFAEMSWEEIVEEARGQTVFWYMWGGSDAINTFVNGYVASRLEEEYGVDLEVVPVVDATTFVNKVLGEKQAGRDTNGSVDLMWINGENFRTMRDANLLFGPYAERLPNTRYVDLADPSVKNDFGYPTEGYESPYGSAQVVMIYDSARVSDPPTNVGELLDWIRAHPGKFTYPTIPDFVGSVFVRHIFYHVAEDLTQLMGPFDQAAFDEVATETWRLLNDIEPSLWREGSTYPESQAQMQNLFANGEVFFNVSYNPNSAANLVSQGRYPDSTRTFVFDSGTIANSHYVAIPYNSPHKAAAVVVANLLLDPATQYEKSKPQVWGDPTILDIERLPDEWQEEFRELPIHPSALPANVLNRNKLPELQPEWLSAIEKGWTEHVLQQ